MAGAFSVPQLLATAHIESKTYRARPQPQVSTLHADNCVRAASRLVEERCAVPAEHGRADLIAEEVQGSAVEITVERLPTNLHVGCVYLKTTDAAVNQPGDGRCALGRTPTPCRRQGTAAAAGSRGLSPLCHRGALGLGLFPWWFHVPPTTLAACPVS